jgi:hypothetical protein
MRARKLQPTQHIAEDADDSGRVVANPEVTLE